MEIKKINIAYYQFNSFERSAVGGEPHTKQLPFLSVVQSTKGSYGIKLGAGERYETHEGGFFIAPSHVTQDIIHNNNSDNAFSSRFVFLDVIINDKYRIDDVFNFPVIPEKQSIALFNREFDIIQSHCCVCDFMCSLYRIIKELLNIASEKNHLRYDRVYPLIEYIQNNYKKEITSEEMAQVMKMSQSNLYNVFKKATGISPVKYLNEYRLSIGSFMLSDTDKKIEQIASETGIYDQFYFSRLFKEKYGMSPSEYRKQQKLY